MIPLCLALSACAGPLMVPVFERLDSKDQAEIDQDWNNMLMPPNRLNRELLLDVMIAYQLHERGVNRATYHSEKDFAAGVVVMDINFDRTKPDDDRFDVAIYDRDRKLIRRERYAGEEIRSHIEALYMPTTGPSTQDSTADISRDEQLRQKWIVARMQQIVAATQPDQLIPITP